MTNQILESLVKLQKRGINKLDTHDIFTILLIIIAFVAVLVF